MISYHIHETSPKSSRWMSLLALILLLSSALAGPSIIQAGAQPEGLDDPGAILPAVSPKNFSPPALGQPGPALQPFYTPAPTVTVSAGSVMLGETFTITATFENTGDGSDHGPTGYGPFIDLYIPHKGADGVYPNEATYDGISPASGSGYTASLDGEGLTVVTQTFPDEGFGTGCVTHPWGVDDEGIFLQVCGIAGDQLVSIELPYGSYTTGQPRLSVTIPARLSVNADPGTYLTIRGRGGFKYGATPMVDWCCTDPLDTTLLSDSGAPSSWAPFFDLNPTVIDFSKATSAEEVATGPNSEATFTISVDLAPGQSFSNIDITDTLPNNLVYMGGLVTDPPADSITQPSVDGLPHEGDTIQIHWNGPIDSSVFSTITASFNYYIPELDAAGVPIAPGTTTNTATLDQIIWTPADGSADQDLSGGVGIGSASTSDQPITLSKGRTVAIDSPPTGFTPGDVILYTLTFEISDYFGFDNLSLVDVLPDGQHYYEDLSHYPTLSITRDSAIEEYDFDDDNITVDCDYSGGPGSECDLDSKIGNTGETTISFDLDQELLDEVADTQVLGDLVDDGGSAAGTVVTGTVQFYAIMLDKYTDIHLAPDDYVKMGDSQTNSAAISGNQIDPGSCIPGPCTITAVISGNTASAGITVGRGTLDKSIVALNGDFCNFGDPCESVTIAAGDLVTYRIQYDLLTGDYADLIFTDFLPLPIFFAEDPNVVGASLSSWPQDTVNAVPDTGHWTLGDNDTLGLIPSTEVSPHTEDNYLRFVYGDHDDETNTPKTIEILFTAKVTDERYGDGLLMRNSVLQQDANSPGVTSTSSSNVDLILTEPVLVGEKSVVSTDHAGVTPDPAISPPISFIPPGSPGSPPWNIAAPINSDYLDANDLSSGIDGIDGGDLVKFALVIENTGSGIYGAYDITVKDTLPAGYIFPGIGLGGFNLQVYRGDGFALDDGTGAGLEFLGTPAPGDPTDFFGDGIRLRDPEDNPFVPADPEYGQGLCEAHDSANGKNVIVITYDLLVDPSVSPGTILQNVGEILNYSGEEGGENYLPGPESNPQDSVVDVPDLAKTRTGTGLVETNNDDDQVVIGEEVYYQLVITFPEGSGPNTVITDTLDNGLGFVSQDSFTIDSGDLSFTGSSVPVISNAGRTITWNLDTVTNSNDDNSVDETITITYTVQTLNTLGNQHGSGVNNAVAISWDALDSEGGTVMLTEGPVSAEDAQVVEPQIIVTKDVVVGLSGVIGDAGDSVLYTIEFTANPARPTAYEAYFSDDLPPDIDFSSPGYGISTVSDSAGILDLTSFEITGGGELRLVDGLPIDMAPGRTIEITLTGELLETVYTGQVIRNDAVVTWSSQSGDHNSGDEDGERDGSDGAGGLNDYEGIGTVDIDIITPSPGKTVVSTSEAHSGTISGIPRLVIGEILRYRIEVRLAEGTNNDLILRDNLPSGLVFLNDGTAKVAFVADDTGDIASTTTADSDAPGISDPGAYFSGDQDTLSGITPTSVLGDANISRLLSGNDDNYGSGTDIYFKLGDVFNGEEDLNSEFAVVEFNVLVVNISGNQQGTSRYNNFSVYVDMDGDQNAESGEVIETSSSMRIIIAEPTLQITKTIDTAPHDAGDTIIYQLEIENLESGNNDATAFDLVLTDTFDNYLEDLNIDSVTTTQGSPCLGNTAYGDDGGNISGQDLTFTATCLDQGQTITLMISAVLAYNVPAGYDLQNDGAVRWTSLPGEKGTAVNPTGSDVDDTSTTEDESGGSRGERNGSASPVVNDYHRTDNADRVLDVPVPVKSIVSTSASHTSELGDGSAGNPRDLAIGEIIRYRLAITLPEGTNTSLILEDILPAGFSYVGDSTVQIAIQVDQDLTLPVDLAGANQDTLPPTFTLPSDRISVSGQQVTFDLGTLLNEDDDAGVEYVVIDFDVLVNNDANNDNTDLKNNGFDVYLGINQVGTSNQVETRIVEPILEISKTASTTTPAYEETFTYTLDLTHAVSGLPADTSMAGAFDIVVTDTIPAGLSYVPGSAVPALWSPVFDGTDTLTWTCSSPCSLGLGSSASLAYGVTMTSPPPPPAPGAYFDNTAAISWTSLDGVDSNERTADDNGGTEPYNDYRDSSLERVQLTNPELRISKTDGELYYIPGESVTYTIVVENIGNAGVADALVEDPLPLEVAPPNNPMISSWDWVCIGSTGGATGCTDSLGLAGEFTDLVDLPAGSSITYEVTAHILSSATGELANTVSVSMPDGVIEPTVGDNSATDSDIQESHADLSVSKDDGITITSPGYAITYTVVASNSSPSDVTGAVVADLIPAEIDSWTWDCTTIPATGGATGCDGVTNSSGNFSDTVNLPAGSSITYLVTAQISADASDSLTNTVTVDVPDDVDEDYPDDNTATDVDYFPLLSKSLDGARHEVVILPNVAIGEVLTYEIRLSVPVGTMPNTHLVDSLDVGLAFVGCEPISDSGLATTLPTGFADICSDAVVTPNSGPEDEWGSQVDFYFGTLSNSSGDIIDLVVRYEVVVLDSLDNQSDTSPPLENNAAWIWDSGRLDAAPVPVTIQEPDLIVTKSASPSTLYPGQLTTFTLEVSHTPGSQTSAFDVVLTDILPDDLIYQPPIRQIAGQAPTTIDESGLPTLRMEWDEFLDDGTSSVFEIDVMLDPDFNRRLVDQTITNEVALSWTSLAIPSDVQQSIYNPLSTERFYDPLSAIDIYRAVDGADLRIPRLPDTGFAPGRVTPLPVQSAEAEYGDLGGLRLEIPDLDLSLPIVSVPRSDKGYDLTWLWDQAGWLEGTAYPSWQGNTVITAHAYLPSGFPGPFVDLRQLSWGDEILLYANGMRYTYQVRDKDLVSADDLSVLGHKDQDWLTLFTCQSYSEALAGYRWRQVVQAVLIKVDRMH